MINKRRAVRLAGETLRDVGILVVVFGPLDAFFQTEEVSAGVVSLLAALGLLLIGWGIIIEAGVEVKR